MTAPSPWDTLQHFGHVELSKWTLTAPWAQVISTFIVGAIVAYVAWRQWQTARQKLALDLFEKRYEIYDDLTAHYGDAPWKEKKPFNEIVPSVEKATFLFGDDVLTSVAHVISLEEGTKEHRQSLLDLQTRMRSYMRFDDSFGARKRLRPIPAKRKKRILAVLSGLQVDTK